MCNSFIDTHVYIDVFDSQDVFTYCSYCYCLVTSCSWICCY